MSVLVESCEKTKSGKAWRVKASGVYYNAFLDSGIENHVGKYIEAEITTHEKYGAAISAFRPVAAPQVFPPLSSAYPAAPPAVAAPHLQSQREPQYAEPAKPGTVATYWLPFASNCVAHAIAAGKIETPNQIREWVSAAKDAVMDVDSAPF